MVRQCELVGVRRSEGYYEPVAASEEDLALMGLLDRQHLSTAFYGTRRMAETLRRGGHPVCRKRVQGMRLMGLEATYKHGKAGEKSKGHKVYPYLLRGVTVTRPNHAWARGITYLPMVRGFLYLVAILDWACRYVLSSRL